LVHEKKFIDGKKEIKGNFFIVFNIGLCPKRYYIMEGNGNLKKVKGSEFWQFNIGNERMWQFSYPRKVVRDLKL